MSKKHLGILALTVLIIGLTTVGIILFTRGHQFRAAAAAAESTSSFTTEDGTSERIDEPIDETDTQDVQEEQTALSAEEISDVTSDIAKKDAETVAASDEDTGKDNPTASDQLSAADDKETDIADMAQVLPFPEPKTMYVQTPVNVRKGPDTSFEKIGFLQLNEKLTILGQCENDGWYHFIYHGEDAFVSNLYVAETIVEMPEAAPEPAASSDAPILAETSEPSAPEPAPAPQPVNAAGVLFIGDSRCVQMKEAVGGGGCSWICENAKGYNWLIETALARADSIIGSGTKVVMCLGVNDTRNCNDYAAIMNQKAAEWAARGAKTYYVSVNPVWENPYTSEEQVENFNASIIGQLSGITWIDTHSWLTANGYRLVDGLHYDDNTYINIFNVIIGSL